MTLKSFPHSTTSIYDEAISTLIHRHGNDGYATYYILLELSSQNPEPHLFIYAQYIAESVARSCNLKDVETLFSIIQTCVEVELFCQKAWEGGFVHSPLLWDLSETALKKVEQVETYRILEGV